MVSLLLPLNRFHTKVWLLYFDFEQVNADWDISVNWARLQEKRKTFVTRISTIILSGYFIFELEREESNSGYHVKENVMSIKKIIIHKCTVFSASSSSLLQLCIIKTSPVTLYLRFSFVFEFISTWNWHSLIVKCYTWTEI